MSTSTNIVDCSIANTFFDSGGSGSDYGNNQNRTMTFSPSIPGDFIQLTFTNFDLRELDMIAFYDGASTAGNLIGIYTGNTNIGTIGATSPSGAITIVFTSNVSSTTDGWEADITCSSTPVQPTVAFMTDNVVFTTCNATFYDQGGDSFNYNDNQTQTMTFLPGISGDFIQITFTVFDINDLDFISFYNGTSTSDSLIGTYTGNTPIGIIGATNANGAITVVFTSNTSDSDDGWEATVECKPISVSSTVAFMTDGAYFRTCGGTFYDQGGADFDYKNNENQTMTISPPLGEAISISFTTFDLRDFDSLAIYDGSSPSATLLGTFSGNTLPGTFTASTPCGELTFVFTSNGSNTNDGWVADIAPLDCITNPLPIELIDFSANIKNKVVALDWQTASEINNDYFTVERSIDAAEWEVVAIVNGAGNSSSILTYQNLDYNPYPGVSYYRLKQTDFNGLFSYSKIQSVNTLDKESLNPVVYPNPNNGLFYVKTPSFNVKVPLTFSIYDLAGNLILTKEINKSLHENSYLVDATKIPKGFYYIVINSKEFSSKKKLIIQ